MKFYESVVVIFIVVILAGYYCNSFYKDNQRKDVEEIVNFVKETTKNNKKTNIFDPDNYLSLETRSYINRKITENDNYSIKIFVVASLNYHNNIEDFVNKLSFILYPEDEQDAISITALFSIKDRIMRIRTGKTAKKILADYLCENIFLSMKKDLKKEDYNKAFIKLADNLDYYLNLNIVFRIGHYLFDLFLKVFSLLFIFGIICFLIYYLAKDLIDSICLSSEKKDFDNKMQKLKDFYQKNELKKEFFNLTCVICLEEIPNLEETKDKNIEKEKLLESSRITLNCGHSFHNKCIAKWTSKNKKCPICRESMNFDIGSKPRNIVDGIVRIQRDNYPRVNRNLYFSWNENNCFTWRHLNVNRFWNSRGSSRSSWGSSRSSGGFTGRW